MSHACAVYIGVPISVKGLVHLSAHLVRRARGGSRLGAVGGVVRITTPAAPIPCIALQDLSMLELIQGQRMRPGVISLVLFDILVRCLWPIGRVA